MWSLSWANLTHCKIRTGLSMLAVAIAITLLLVLVGLANGTLNEVARRMESVDAEIVVRDRQFDLGSMGGGKLWEKEIPTIAAVEVSGAPAVAHVIPVFLGRMKLGGLSQNVFGVRPDDFAVFAAGRRLVAGALFDDPDTPAAAWDESRRTTATLPLIIDQRLARAARLDVGDTAQYGDTPAIITGIVETGVAGRVFAPLNRLRAANGVAAETTHMFFVKARPGMATEQLYQLRDGIEAATGRSATLVANYGQVLAENYRNLRVFVSLVSVIALVICFLFICVTMYTMVLERRREIAILQSLGANRRTVLTQTVQEALLICGFGTVLGCGFTYAAQWAIQTAQPLMTVETRLSWLLGAAAIGLGGGVFSALYPGYIAVRRDPVEALSFD